MTPEIRDAYFRAMGTDCHIRVVGDGDLEFAESEIRRLEALWTRFADSELVGLDADPKPVHPDTQLLVERSLEGYEMTGGLFNPFMAAQISQLGYDRDFEELQPHEPASPTPAERPIVTVSGDTVSTNLAIDSGGIGKGLAADLVCQRLLERGASGALVNLGGDLRCAGQPPAQRWQIEIEAPVQLQRDLSVRLDGGAVCTSTPMLRTWLTEGGQQMHHLLDPRTGAPMQTDLAAVSVIAPQAWLAEVLTKAVLLAPRQRARELLRASDAGALLISRAGAAEQL